MRCIWLLFFSLSLCAQTVNLSNLGTGTMSLAGRWKFHPGDDPRWADPNFDDSDWKLVKMPLSLDKQGYPKFSGYGWYRLTLYCDPHTTAPELRLALSGVSDIGAFFANGVQFGQFGVFPPAVRSFLWRPISFPIASSQWQNGHLLLAVRTWASRDFQTATLHGYINFSKIGSIPATIGSPTAIRNLVVTHRQDRQLNRSPAMLAKWTGIILAFYLLGLYFTESQRPEYLWLGLSFAFDALYWLIMSWIAQDTFLLSVRDSMSLGVLLTPLLLTTVIIGIWSVFNIQVGRWLKRLLYFISIYYLIYGAVIEFGSLTTWERYSLLNSLIFPITICSVLFFLVRRAWSTSGELRWFALSFIPSFATLLMRFVSSIPVIGKHIDFRLMELLVETASAWTVIAVGFLLMRRSGRARAEQDRLHAEMKAAQQVQKLMLPAQSNDAPHVQIDAAYLPSQEVSGDFYQTAKGSDDSLLLIIGDVSGKGLQAALTMSLIVGLWQEVVTTTQSPREILGRFNLYLQRRLSGGFVTCLCARLQPDGQLTVANAGHLAPYLNGIELDILNDLPLGVSAESNYDESHFLLSPTDTLVLISDGVVEARDKSQSFYGFERLQKTLQECPEAEVIARQAQQFGQEDDITVIAISPRVVAAKSIATQAAFAV